MAFEKKVPDWNAEGVEPPESLKTSGFTPGYRPPAAFFNWFWTGVSKALAELQEMTPDTIGAAEADLSNVDKATFKQFANGAGVSGVPIVAATSTDGAAYTATIDGITELKNGFVITIIPNINSTTTAPTLNVNGMGAVPIRIPLSINNAIMTQPENAGYYVAGRPISLQFDADHLTTGVWKTYGKQRASGQDLYGVVPIENGGTGAETAEEARTNLGAAASEHDHNVFSVNKAGFVPGPTEASTDKFLCADGGWAEVPIRLFYGTEEERDAHAAREGDIWLMVE